MKIDVIIPVYKPDYKLFLSVARLIKQTIVPNEIILLHTVHGDYTTDFFCEQLRTLHIPKSDAFTESVKIRAYSLTEDEFDHGATRDIGAKLSSADLVLFMTQDAIPADFKLIENMYNTLMEDDVAICYARQIAYYYSTYKEKVTREFNYPDESVIKSFEDIETLGIKAFFSSNVCAMYRKDVYLKLGGFPKHTIFNEDMIFAYHAISEGYKIAYDAKAQVYHTHRYTNKEQFSRSFDNGVSHNEYSEIFDNIRTENEGIKYLKYLSKRAIEDKRAYMIVEYFLDCTIRYAGFLLGKHYNLLPKSIVKKISMNKKYWD